MKKVITYGTYDLLHEGHIRLLKRAKNWVTILLWVLHQICLIKTEGR